MSSLVILGISIHAPVKGATVSPRCFHSRCPDFNPRSREGSDDRLADWLAHHPISIHAPVKGATVVTATLLASKAVFQSTLP